MMFLGFRLSVWVKATGYLKPIMAITSRLALVLLTQMGGTSWADGSCHLPKTFGELLLVAAGISASGESL